MKKKFKISMLLIPALFGISTTTLTSCNGFSFSDVFGDEFQETVDKKIEQIKSIDFSKEELAGKTDESIESAKKALTAEKDKIIAQIKQIVKDSKLNPKEIIEKIKGISIDKEAITKTLVDLKSIYEEKREEVKNKTLYNLYLDNADVTAAYNEFDTELIKTTSAKKIDELTNNTIEKINSIIKESTKDNLDDVKQKVAQFFLDKKVAEDSELYDKELIVKFNTEIDEKVKAINNAKTFEEILEVYLSPLENNLGESSDEISFHFPYLNSSHTGDCVFVKAGDTDILIDAGSEQSSAENIRNYLIDNKLVTDNKIEHVIATHAHKDHIAGFFGKEQDGIFYKFKIDNIIDFGYYGSYSSGWCLNNAKDIEEANKSETLKKTISSRSLYSKYLDARAYAVENGAKHTTVYDYFKEHEGEKSWDITVGNNLKMSILYQWFYDHPNSSKAIEELNSDFSASKFSNQNDFSVFTLFTQGEDRHALFTGDGETYSEYSLTQEHDLPKVDLFKAGHHGSFTANTKFLLDEIQPEMAVCCCVCGNQEYTSNKAHSFPSQEFFYRISPWTDRVYSPTLGDWDDKKACYPLNGDIVVTYNAKGEETVSFSHSDKIMKDTEWFKENRICPKAWGNPESKL